MYNKVKAYHTDLFSKQDLATNLQDSYISNIDTQIPPEVKTMMDAEIRPGEIYFAIQQFAKNKTPGIDGLPIEFYDTFWDDIKDFFPQLLNDIYSNGLLPSIQQRMSIITLSHKKENKDKTLHFWKFSLFLPIKADLEAPGNFYPPPM